MVDEKTYLSLYYGDMLSETDYYLRLNAEKTDMVNLKLNTDNTECFTGHRSVERFFLNEEEIQRDNDSYSSIIQK